MTDRRDRTALNLGMQELQRIIPDLDPIERSMLTGTLASALIELVGPDGTFSAQHDGKLYEFRLYQVRLLYDPDDFAPELDTHKETDE